MIERLSQFIQNQGISVRSFEQSIGASDGMIRRAINNHTDIQSKWLLPIADNFPHLNIDWLITGRGPMLKEKEVAFQEPQLAISADIQRIPIVDLSVAAGSGYINLNYVEEIDSIALFLDKSLPVS